MLTTEAESSLPLFPLSRLLLPGQRLSLQIFEPRYLTMITAQLRSGAGFGVVQIREGRETGAVPLVFPVGTEAAIVDWHQRPNGLLGLQVEGRRRFRLRRSEVQADQLLVADVQWLAAEPLAAQTLQTPQASQTAEYADDPDALMERYDGLQQLLAQLRLHPAVAQLGFAESNNASQLGWQLTQLLPLSLPDKMALWELQCPATRLEHLAERVARLVSR